MAHLLTRLPALAASSLYTCFLFTKSDIKTTVIPVSALAVASAPLHNLPRLAQVVFWVWLHVLQCDVSNQTMDPDEDEKNKSYRPLPAKRISLAAARRFRWLLVPACFALSAFYSIETLCTSVSLVGLTIIYNELGGHKGHWAVRNGLNALGLGTFETGATLIAGVNPSRLDGVAWWSIIASAGVIMTTIHAQDFKDVDGDRAIGRKTIPIVFGNHAKWTILIPLLFWSVGLCVLWQVDLASCASFVLLAAVVSLQYFLGGGTYEYQVAFYWYNVWLSAAHVLPAYYRIYSS